MKKEKNSKLLNVVLLFSGGLSGGRYLEANDPHYGVTYYFGGAVTDNADASGILWCKEKGIPCKVLDMKQFVRDHSPNGKLKEMTSDLYAEYFSNMLSDIWGFADSKGNVPDLIICSGFMRIIRDPLLSAYKRRMGNVHPSDLRIEDATGKRKFIGDKAVHLAFEYGESSTASTVHFIEEGEIDGGEIICVSDKLMIEPGDTPEIHQNKMKDKCDGPALVEAMNLICSGKIKLGE